MSWRRCTHANPASLGLGEMRAHAYSAAIFLNGHAHRSQGDTAHTHHDLENPPCL
jgi:hypothetical protein